MKLDNSLSFAFATVFLVLLFAPSAHCKGDVVVLDKKNFEHNTGDGIWFVNL